MTAPEVFVCHGSGDRDTAGAVVAGLEARGVACWIAPRDVPAGANYAQAILTGIGECEMLVLVFSAYANQSPHVAREVERAVSRGLPILPLRIEPVDPEGPLEYFVSSSQWVEASDRPVQEGVDELAAAVLERLGRGGEEAAAAPEAPAAPEASGGFASAPRETLRELVARYGTELAGDSRRVRSLLKDIVGEYRLEISALVIAAEEGVGQALLTSSDSLGPAKAFRLAGQLQSERGLSAEAAMWAVEAWAEALDIRLFVPPPVAVTDQLGATVRAPAPVPDSVAVPGDPTAAAAPPAETMDPAPATAQAAAERNPWAWIAGAAVLVLLAGLIAVVLRAGDDEPIAAVTTTLPTTTAPTTTAATTTAVPTTTAPPTTVAPPTTEAPTITVASTTTAPGEGGSVEPTCPESLGIKTLDHDSRSSTTTDDITTESLICVYRVANEEDWWSLSVYWVEPGGNGRFVCASTDYETGPDDVPWSGISVIGDTAVRVHYHSTTAVVDEDKDVLRAAAESWLPDVVDAGAEC